jgi:hypothetical protein
MAGGKKDEFRGKNFRSGFPAEKSLIPDRKIRLKYSLFRPEERILTQKESESSL